MKRCVIVGGADINNYDYIKTKITDNDYVVFCDSGLKHMKELGISPSLIIGDFDSHKIRILMLKLSYSLVKRMIQILYMLLKRRAKEALTNFS